jgi:hypothetical protein
VPLGDGVGVAELVGDGVVLGGFKWWPAHPALIVRLTAAATKVKAKALCQASPRRASLSGTRS